MFVVLCRLGLTAGPDRGWSPIPEFDALFYRQTILKVNPQTANIVTTVRLVLGRPALVLFGALSEKISRKKIMLAGSWFAGAAV